MRGPIRLTHLERAAGIIAAGTVLGAGVLAAPGSAQAAALGERPAAMATRPGLTTDEGEPIAWVGDDRTRMTLQDALSAAGIGETVHVLEGQFTFKSTTVLAVPRRVTITSQGSTDITARFSVTGGGLTTTGITLHPVSTAAVVSVASGAQLTGLNVKHTPGILRPTGIQLAPAATGVSIVNFTMDGGDEPLSYGVNLTTGSATITGANLSRVATGIGITAASTASGISVVGGTIAALTVGVALGTATGPKVSGATITGEGVGTGIDLANSKDGSVSGGTVTGFARGIATSPTSQADGPSITDPIVKQASKEGIALGSTTGAVVSTPQITGTGAAQSNGISIYKATGVTLDRVAVSGFANGVTTSTDNTGAGPTIISPRITDVSLGGILLGSTQGATITDPQLDGNGAGSGINTQNGGEVTVSDARIDGFLYGVAAQTTGLDRPGRRDYSLTGVTVTSATAASSGIYLQGTTDARIENLNADVRGGGIILHEAKSTVAEHVAVTGHEAASSTAGSAILRAYDSDGVTLDDASIGEGSYGLFFSSTTDARITNARVSGVVEYGLYARSSSHLDIGASTFVSNAAMGNLVVTTPSNGISHDVDIHDNTITGNDRGLNVYTGTRRVTFSRNRVSGGGYAVYASPAHDLTIDANQIGFTSDDRTEGAIRIGSSYANPDTARLLRSRARAVTLQALARELGRDYTQRSSGPRLGCSLTSPGVAACRVAWTGARRHLGVVTVRRLDAIRWRYALRVRAGSGGPVRRVGQIRLPRAADYTSSGIRILSNRFTGAGTFIEAGSPAGTDDVLSDVVEVSGNVFPKDSIAIRAYPNAEQDVTGDPPAGDLTALDARDSGSRGGNDFGSPCRARVTSGAAQDQSDPTIYNGGGAWIHETREPQVLYPEACPVDVRVSKLVSAPSVAPGQAIEWIISVVNDGSALARDVVMADTLPAGFTITGFDTTEGAAVCERAGQQLRCALGDVPPASGALIAVRGSADAPGTLDNTATVSSTTPDSDPGNNSASRSVEVIPTPAPAPLPAPAPGGELTVTKTADRSVALVGEPVTYTLRVRNTGAGPTASVLVVDQFSAPVEIVSVDAGSGRCATSLPIICTVDPLSPGEEVTVKIVATSLEPGILRNAGAASGSVAVLVPPPPFAGDLVNFAVARVAVRSGRAELALQKTPRQLTRRPGELLTQRLVVTSERAAASALRVCDRPRPGLQVISAPGARRDAAGACWTIPRLERGATRRLTITLRVDPGRPNGIILNRAFARAAGTRIARAQARVYVIGTSACGSTLRKRTTMACREGVERDLVVASQLDASAAVGVSRAARRDG